MTMYTYIIMSSVKNDDQPLWKSGAGETGRGGHGDHSRAWARARELALEARGKGGGAAWGREGAKRARRGAVAAARPLRCCGPFALLARWREDPRRRSQQEVRTAVGLPGADRKERGRVHCARGWGVRRRRQGGLVPEAFSSQYPRERSSRKENQGSRRAPRSTSARPKPRRTACSSRKAIVIARRGRAQGTHFGCGCNVRIDPHL